MSSDWIDNSFISDEQRRAAEAYLEEVGADLSLDRRMGSDRREDLRLFANNDRHDLHGYLGHTEDGDIAIILPEAPPSLQGVRLTPGDPVVVQTAGDQFTGRLRQTFHGRRSDDPGRAFILTIQPN